MSLEEKVIYLDKIEVSIKMIKLYVNDVDASEVIAVLESMLTAPEDVSLEPHLQQLSDSLEALGIYKGAVLSYAPYLNVLLSENLFEE